ncbi:MAG: hypothetical protein P9X24_17490 [Candidatus Hatepunaea meridiana]|nr:hypothetical protein [Candidatus Hatepunaea meridiana]
MISTPKAGIGNGFIDLLCVAESCSVRQPILVGADYEFRWVDSVQQRLRVSCQNTNRRLKKGSEVLNQVLTSSRM